MNNNFIWKIYNSSHWFERIYQNSILSVPLHKIKQFFIWLNYKIKMIKQSVEVMPRELGVKDKRFHSLKELKGKYKGKRIFITCTGPSLTIDDLELLKDEYVFGMNSICLIHDKTDWKPDFFSCQDLHVFKKIKDTLLSTDNGQVFLPYLYKQKFKTPNKFIYFHMSGAYHLYEMIYGFKYFAKFSDDCYKTVYDGYTITYSIIQLAIYMGFDELYLLGADCNYLGQQQHFIETGHYDPGAQYAAERMLASYRVAKDYAETHRIKIFNATRGGCLELFPRIELEEVLVKKEKNKLYK